MARGAYPVTAGHGAPLAPGVALDEVEHATRRVAGAEFRGALSAEQFYRLLGDLREPGGHRRRALAHPQFQPAVPQGEQGRGKLRRGRVHLVSRRGDIADRGGRGQPAVLRDVAGEPPHGVAQRARLRELTLGGVRAGPFNAGGVEPLVHVGRGAQFIVNAVRVRMDRAHQAHGQRFLGQHPGPRRGRGCRGGRHAQRLSRLFGVASVRGS